MSPPAQLHTPVLLHTCVELLAPALERPGAVVVDATLGMGGHSEALLERFGELRLIGLDRDPSAIRLATQRLAPYAERIDLVQAVYDELPEVLRELSVREVNGVLFDLGVSSLQLDSDARGFSYARDTELDMRMNPDDPQTAADVLNTYSVAELTRVLRDFGEERFARRIAQRVVAERASEPFSTSGRLVELIRQCVPAATRRTGGNPAKRTFQALRIEVNRELDVLRRAVPSAIEALAVGGRIAVMSYHSGEDRIVKQALRDVSTSTAPPDLPVVPEEYQPVLRLLTRGAQTADPAEVAVNPRAASVRLRAGERVRPATRGGQRSGKAQRPGEAQRSVEAQGSGEETA